MKLSLKSIATNCLSWQGPKLSAKFDIFGYKNVVTNLPLGLQLKLASGKSIDVNLIVVGDYSNYDLEKIPYAVQIARDIFAKVDLGIRKIEWCFKSDAEVGDFKFIDSRVKANLLTYKFHEPNNNLDVFFVSNIYIDKRWIAGLSPPMTGPCQKGIAGVQTGCIVKLSVNSKNMVGVTIAHEIGHYLGNLPDIPLHDSDNFMKESTDDEAENREIEESQGNMMLKHCYIRECIQ